MAITIHTDDGLALVGEVAEPTTESKGAILCLHPLPTHGGMMDSHLFKKAANRLPALSGITVVRFNTRGTASERGTSGGHFAGGENEKFDVEAAINYCFDKLNIEKLWIVGWSFGTEIALKHAKDPRVKGLILLSPPLKRTTSEELNWWRSDQRTITCLIPEFDDFLPPKLAIEKFSQLPNAQLIIVNGAKHLWVGETFVHRVLSEICKVVNPAALPLPLEI